MEKQKPFVSGDCFWIWSWEGCSQRRIDGSPSAYEVRRIRRVFEVDSGTEFLKLHLSADSRYVLYIDGEWIGRGPAHGDVRHQFYDSYDLRLSAGEHCIAVLVLDYSPVQCHPPTLGAPGAVVTRSGGLAAELWSRVRNGPWQRLLKTDESWVVAVDRARRFRPGKVDWFGGFVGLNEHFVAREDTMRGWECPGYDDREWERAVSLYEVERYESIRDGVSPYGLMPRMVPMEEQLAPIQPERVFAPGGGPAGPGWDALLTEERALELAAGGTHEVIIDYPQEWTAFPTLEIEDGDGAEVRIGYAEALRIEHSVEDAVIFGRDGDASDVAIGFNDATSGWTFDRRGRFEGFEDVIEPDGAYLEWMPHHWRTAKFIRLSVRTGANPLRIRRFTFAPCHYPFKSSEPFRCSEGRMESIYEISLHTLKLGTHETFLDCPYYEQLQYIGDSALNAQVAMLNGGAYPLVKQLLHHFDWSRVPEGWTQSRYPSRIEGIIPSQSLDWIAAIHAYGLHTGDFETVGEVWPGAKTVLDTYARHCGAEGLPEGLPYWNWVDWCPGWKRGVPPGALDGPVLSHAGKYGLALRQGAAIARWLREDDTARSLLTRHESLREAARAAFWEGTFFHENRKDAGYGSRLGNAYAVLAGFLEEGEGGMLREVLVSDRLADCSYFGCYFVREALWKLGGCDLQRELALWFRMLDMGLTSWAEDTVFWRSLCHGWTANPVIDFHTRVLGVRPLAPGFREMRIEPAVMGFESCSGSTETPHGPVHVAWNRSEGELRVRLPGGCMGELRLPDGTVMELGEGAKTLKIDEVLQIS